MLGAARDKVEQEKQWLLSKIGLIPDHDDGRSFQLLEQADACLLEERRRDGRAKMEFLFLASVTGA